MYMYAIVFFLVYLPFDLNYSSSRDPENLMTSVDGLSIKRDFELARERLTYRSMKDFEQHRSTLSTRQIQNHPVFFGYNIIVCQHMLKIRVRKSIRRFFMQQSLSLRTLFS